MAQNWSVRLFALFLHLRLLSVLFLRTRHRITELEAVTHHEVTSSCICHQTGICINPCHVDSRFEIIYHCFVFIRASGRVNEPEINLNILALSYWFVVWVQLSDKRTVAVWQFSWHYHQNCECACGLLQKMVTFFVVCFLVHFYCDPETAFDI